MKQGIRHKIVRCPDIKRVVPRTRMLEGIEKCKKNIGDYLQDARIIAGEGRLYHAVISAEFAVEELGKILLLKESMNRGNDNVVIDGEEFCSHPKKAERAWSNILDRKYQVLFEETWDNARWDTALWNGRKTVISNKMRLECAFVDFIDNNWTLELDIDVNLFLEFIAHVEEKIKTI